MKRAPGGWDPRNPRERAMALRTQRGLGPARAPQAAHRRWTDTEIALLKREHRAGTTLKAVACKLGRKYHCVVTKATSLGLRRVAHWTPREERFLREHKSKGWVWCARALGRSLHAVRSHVVDVGIQFGQEDRETLRTLIVERARTRDERARMRAQLASLRAMGCDSASQRREQIKRDYLGNQDMPSSATWTYVVLSHEGGGTAYDLVEPAARLARPMRWKYPKNRKTIFVWLLWLERRGYVASSKDQWRKVFRVARPLAHRPLSVLFPGLAREAAA